MFEQINGPGRACAMWVDEHAQRQVYLHIANSDSDVHDLALSDIYGNRRPFQLLEGGVASVAISDDPAWLLWSADKPLAVTVEPSLIDAPASAGLPVNSSTPLVVQVFNPLDRPVHATLNVSAQSNMPLAITPAQTAFELKPGEHKNIDLTAKVGDAGNPVTWPVQWTVFCRTAASGSGPARQTALKCPSEGGA